MQRLTGKCLLRKAYFTKKPVKTLHQALVPIILEKILRSNKIFARSSVSSHNTFLDTRGKNKWRNLRRCSELTLPVREREAPGVSRGGPTKGTDLLNLLAKNEKLYNREDMSDKDKRSKVPFVIKTNKQTIQACEEKLYYSTLSISNRQRRV